MKNSSRVGLVGGGVIGAGWAARFLLNGHDVAIFDPDPEIARKLETVIGNARRAQAQLFPGLAPPEGRLTLETSIEQAVAGADFVQESLPEREDLKQSVLAVIDRASRPEVVIASSTSGLLPTRLQSSMAHPDRFVVGHPFNPVYLLPLVEVCGGEKTSEATKQAAVEFYASIGMRPLRVRKEIDGFIADRLLEALWREALWLVKDGVATTEEIDDAIRFGAGLRWSFMGTFLIYRMAGGEAGMRHFLAQFGPALKLPWTKLQAPELTDELIDLVSQQSEDQAAGVSIRDLEVRRDDCLVAVLSALRANDFAAGAVVREHEERLRNPSAAPLRGQGCAMTARAALSLASANNRRPIEHRVRFELSLRASASNPAASLARRFPMPRPRPAIVETADFVDWRYERFEGISRGEMDCFATLAMTGALPAFASVWIELPDLPCGVAFVGEIDSSRNIRENRESRDAFASVRHLSIICWRAALSVFVSERTHSGRRGAGRPLFRLGLPATRHNPCR